MLTTFGAAAVSANVLGPRAVLLVAMLLLTYTFTISFAPTLVRIGTDGIATRWLGQRNFIPFTRVASAATYSDQRGTKITHGVRLQLTNGEEIKLAGGQSQIGLDDAKRLARRIEEARAAHAAGHVAQTTGLLARGERPTLEWVRALRGMGAAAGGPRTAAVPVNKLLQVVEDATASAMDRLGAAVAALSSEDADAARRVRVAAETTVSPKLRVALDRIVETQDDDAVAEAFEELERES
jgi:hypothetical protein